MLGYLTLVAHSTCAQKESGSVQTNLLMQAVLMGNDTVYKTIGIDNICMRMFDEHVRTLTRKSHVPDLRKNLLLLRALEVQRCKFLGADGGTKVTKGSMMILKGERMMNLYKMIGSVIIGNASVTTEKEDSTRLWHMRLGYMSERDIQALHNQGALPYIKYYKLGLCKFCIMGRQRRVAFSTSQYTTNGLLDRIHTDVWGPSPVASIGVLNTISHS